MLREYTDYFDVCIGGLGHLVNLRKKHRVGQASYSKPAYNLAYLPQFKTFYEKYNQQFSVRNLKELEDTMKDGLNYGTHLSKAIRKRVTNHIVGRRSAKKGFSLAEAQNLLFSTWASWTDTNSELFPGWRNKRSKTRWSLLLHEDELYLVKSKTHLSRHISLGFGLIPMGMGVSSSERFFMNHGKVTNVYDAVRKISGIEHVQMKNLELSCCAPSAKSMKEILGGLAFVCTFLSGREKAERVFAGAASTPRRENPQLVQFNLPISLGMACSSISLESQVVSIPNLSSALRDIMMLMSDSELKVDCSYDYNLPLILGGDQENENLRKALKQSVDRNSQESVPGHEPSNNITVRTLFAVRDSA